MGRCFYPECYNEHPHTHGTTTGNGPLRDDRPARATPSGAEPDDDTPEQRAACDHVSDYCACAVRDIVQRAVREERERPCAWCMDQCPECGARPKDKPKP